MIGVVRPISHTCSMTDTHNLRCGERRCLRSLRCFRPQRTVGSCQGFLQGFNTLSQPSNLTDCVVAS